MLHVLAEESLKSFQGNYEKAVNQVVVGNCSEDKFDSLSFHAVAGVRMHRLQRFLGADKTNGYVAVFMTILEPGRALTFWFMQAAEGRLFNNKPFLMHLAVASASPLVASLQYLSGLLSGNPGAARLVWQRRGHASFHQWALALPEEAKIFRRVLLSTCGQLHRRYGLFSEAPYKLVALENDCCSAPEARAIVEAFEQKPACCHRPGMAQRLKALKIDLRSESSRAWIWPWSLSLTLSLSNTERQHATHKRLNKQAGSGMLWEQFSVASILHQAKCQVQEQHRQERKRGTQSQNIGGLCLSNCPAYSAACLFMPDGAPPPYVEQFSDA